MLIIITTGYNGELQNRSRFRKHEEVPGYAITAVWGLL